MSRRFGPQAGAERTLWPEEVADPRCAVYRHSHPCSPGGLSHLPPSSRGASPAALRSASASRQISPTYIAEVSPAPWRGRLVRSQSAAIVVGIWLAAQIVNWLIAERVARRAQTLGNDSPIVGMGNSGWRWMFTAVAAPSIGYFLIGAIFIPESPRWLARHGMAASSANTPCIGGETLWRNRIAGIRETLAGEAQANAHTSGDLRTDAERIRRFLASASPFAVLQQWSGINVIFNYAEDIYRSASCSISGILFNIVITGDQSRLSRCSRSDWSIALAVARSCSSAPRASASHTLLGFTYRAG